MWEANFKHNNANPLISILPEIIRKRYIFWLFLEEEKLINLLIFA